MAPPATGPTATPDPVDDSIPEPIPDPIDEPIDDYVPDFQELDRLRQVAVAIQSEIEAAGHQIEGLTVAYSDGFATLSGVAPNAAAREAAGRIASEHEGVTEVGNGIVLAP